MTGTQIVAQDLIAAAEAKLHEIRNKGEAEIGKIRAGVAEKAAQLEGYIQGVKDVVRADGENRPALPAPTPKAAPLKVRKPAKEARRKAKQTRKSAKPKFREGSLPDRIRTMVLEARKPVHLSVAVKKLSRGRKKVSLQSIENRISALARKSHAFVRTGAGTYGLIELGHPPARD